MKREIKNDGVYVECDADQMIENFDRLEKAEVIVITKGRLELAGEDKKKFMTKFHKILDSLNTQSSEFQSMDNLQKVDVIMRGMVA